MAKISNISGFPEWLPQEKLAEDELIEKVKWTYESFGFVPIETPSVELISTLSAKGVEDKELYVLRRARAEEEEEAELGLHFDLTIPFARYVAQHLNDLVFPFKRYQLQRSWRGERPQKGRFREFYQFDADIVARDTLPLACDAEVLMLLEKAFRVIDLGPYHIRVNNRKILLGFYESLGLDSKTRASAVSAVDKLGKVGVEGVRQDLEENLGLSAQQATEILGFSEKKIAATDFAAEMQDEMSANDTLKEGYAEISEILSLLPSESLASIVVDLSLARGLDYYTGLICEVLYDEHLDFGSVGGGGRYDDLVSEYLKKKIPGVGASIGITRIMDLALRNNLLEKGRCSTATVLIAVASEAERARCNLLAEELRGEGVASEVYFKSPKFGKQIEYADKKGIPYVLFLNEQSAALEMKDIRSGEQHAVTSLTDWARALPTEKKPHA